MIVKLHEHALEVVIEDYSPEVIGNRSGHPDTWTEDEPEYVSWYVDSGNLLLDYLVGLYDSEQELVEKEILKRIHEDPNCEVY